MFPRAEQPEVEPACKRVKPQNHCGKVSFKIHSKCTCMNVGFDFLSHIFLFLFMMNTDAYDEDTTSEVVDKIPAPAAASGKFRLFFSFGCFDRTRGNTVVTRHIFVDTGLLDLPDEIVVKILQYLPLSSVIQSLSSTCKRILQLFHTAVLWKRFTLQDTGRPVFYTRHSFKCIFERHNKHFQHLYFNGEFEQDFFLWFTNGNVTRTLGNCSNLVILDLSCNVVNLVHLKELYLEHCTNIDDVVATSVLSRDAHLQALESLSLRMCEQFDYEELIAIARSHPSLRIYKIDGCCNLDVLSAVSILNCPWLSLSEFFMTPDLDCHTIEQWNYLKTVFGEIRLC